ncbi:MAG: glycosyltransferase family protein [Saprospiraceae bacterium]|nr:glycosyltransferase family protein [Saprospiraceae bacterium]
MPKPHILYAVLNWGLGHATRSVPVIKRCLLLGYDVTLASDGFPRKFLRKEFPRLTVAELPTYDVSYGHGVLRHHAWKLFVAVQTATRREHEAVTRLHEEYRFDAVISDNRYGCFLPGIPSALITHQLRIVGSNFLGNQIGTRAIGRWTKPFDYLWVPDHSDRLLSGRMSALNDERIRWIGPLSDLLEVDTPRPHRVACILSGPEPHRTELEQLLLPQLIATGLEVILVRGVDGPNTVRMKKNVKIVDHLNRAGIAGLLSLAGVVICRPGYSSVMDLHKIARQAILIPTPGQPEQEYLAAHLQGFPYFDIQEQDKLDIRGGLKRLREVKQRPPNVPGSPLAITSALRELTGS